MVELGGTRRVWWAVGTVLAVVAIAGVLVAAPDDERTSELAAERATSTTAASAPTTTAGPEPVGPSSTTTVTEAPVTSATTIAPAGWTVLLSYWQLTAPVDARSTTIRIVVEGGGCWADVERLHHVHVEQDDDRVVVAGYITKPAAAQYPSSDGTSASCPSVGVEHPYTVHLDEPLGDRRLEDRWCLDNPDAAQVEAYRWCGDKNLRFTNGM